MESISDTVYIKFCSFCYFGIFKANIKKEIYIYIRLSWRIGLGVCYIDLQVIGQSK